MGIVVINHVTLDGVMQGPGRPDEDRRGGFTLGGWAAPGDGLEGQDPALGEAMGSVMGSSFSWLFGRRTYDDMVGHWNAVGGSFKDGLNAGQKYVVSRGTTTSLPWPNSTLVTGDVRARMEALRDAETGNLVVMGSGVLLRSLLLPTGLVDMLLLIVHPIVLGAGERLFDGVGRFDLRLEKVTTTNGGLALMRYRC